MALPKVALITPVTKTPVAPSTGSVERSVGGGRRDTTAAFSLIRGLTRWLRLSVMGRAVEIRAFSSSVTVAVGLADLSTAQAPAT